MTTASPKLLPHLAGYVGGEPAPDSWLNWDKRKASIESLGPRVFPLLLCEYATSVLPIWVNYDARDKRPHRAIAARLRWCLRPTAAWAAEAAGDAQLRWMYEVFRAARRPKAWRGEWHTPPVVGLARHCFRRRDRFALPILADALEEAGCDVRDTLDWLRGRGESGHPFTRAHHALWLPMGLGD